MNLLGRAKMFFEKPAKKQKRRIDKLEKIVEKLVLKAQRLRKRYEEETREAKREKLQKEHKAVKKLLRKSRKQLEHLKKATEA